MTLRNRLRLLRRIRKLERALREEADSPGPILGAFQKGTLHVPVTGLVLVHPGEEMVPAAARALTAALGREPTEKELTIFRRILATLATRWSR